MKNKKKDTLNHMEYIKEKLEEITKEIVIIDKHILDKYPTHQLQQKILDIKRKRILLGIRLHALHFIKKKKNDYGIENKNYELIKIKKKVKFMDQNIQLLETYNNQLSNISQKNSIDILTVINTIFLPLALITGYFGMNFKSMGAPSLKTGVLAFKNGQLLVFFLFVLSILLTLLLFYTMKKNKFPLNTS